jgi:hypothetical protein
MATNTASPSADVLPALDSAKTKAPVKKTLRPVEEVLAEKAITDAAAKAAEVATTPAEKPTRSAGDKILSYPAGPQSKWLKDPTTLKMPRKGSVTLRMIQAILGSATGKSPRELCDMFHPPHADGKDRIGTTKVYATWDIPRAGFGVERKQGNWFILLPEGLTAQEVIDY